MARVTVSFNARPRGQNVDYFLLVHVESEGSAQTIATTRCGELAGIINVHGSNITVNSLGYSADVPDHAARLILSLEEEPVAEVPLIRERVDKSVYRLAGLHELLVDLGLIKPSDHIPEDLWFSGENCTLQFSEYPEIWLKVAKSWFVLNAYSEEIRSFLKRMLDEGPRREELEIFRGISMLSKRAQRRELAKLVSGKLSLRSLAFAVAKATVFREEYTGEKGWRRMVGWLRRNGFEELARAALVRRTIIEESFPRKWIFLKDLRR